MSLTLLAASAVTALNTATAIISAILGISTIVSTTAYIFRRSSAKRFFDALFSVALNTKNPSARERFRLTHYVKHSFTQENASVPKDATFDEFFETVKNTKITVLTGSAGIGKSILMERLAFKFRTKPSRGQSGKALCDYGILFYKLNLQSDLKKILGEVEQKVNSSSVPLSIFFDGLDELPGLNAESGAKILNELISSLLGGISQRAERIFISLRPEILDGGYSFTRTGESDVIAVFKLKNFDERQIEDMFRNENRGAGNAAKKRDNLKKLKQITAENPDSVFTYPLILTWANEILSDYDVGSLKHISWYDALGKVIDKELEREYSVYRDSRGVALGDTEYPKTGFIGDGKTFLMSIAEKMSLSGKKTATKTDVMGLPVVQKFNETHGETTGNTFLTRRLLRYVDWSEKGGEPYYEFIHNTIYWRALAEAVLSPDTPQSVRAKIVLADAQGNFSTPLMQYCREGLWSKCRSAFTCLDYIAYSDLLRRKEIELSEKGLRAAGVPAEIVLTCFYDFKKLSFDGSIVLDSNKISSFVKDEKLDLSQSKSEKLSIIDLFGDFSFRELDCSESLAKIAAVPKFVKTFSFEGCGELQNVEIKEGITKIPDRAFMNCRSLRGATLPESLSSIGDRAFFGCEAIEKISLPANVREIRSNAFANCRKLIEIAVSAQNENYVSVCGNLYLKDMSALVSYAAGKEEAAFEVPQGVREIPAFAFSGCISLTEITLPSCAKKIGARAFAGAEKLARVNLGDSLEFIGEAAFLMCRSLESVIVPAGVRNIFAATFAECDSLAAVEIAGARSIGNFAFYGCKKLKNISLPEGLEEISFRAFMDCSSLESITIPRSLKSVESYAFDGVTALREVNITDIDAWCDIDFSDYKANPLFYAKILRYNGEEVSEVSVPRGTTKIKPCSFYNCSSIKKVALPEGVTEIGSFAFDGAKNLSEINFPQGIKKIGGLAFSGCASLAEINLPDSVTEIGPNAFNGCICLEKTRLPDNLEKIGLQAFFGDDKLLLTADDCGVKYLGNEKNPYLALVRAAGAKGSFTVNENTKVIGEGAFKDCRELTEVTIPEGVREIGLSAFGGCSELKEVIIPKSVTSVSAHAFRECTKLQKVTFFGEIEKISDCAFRDCRELVEVILPKAGKIDNHAFSGCASLKKFVVPFGVTEIARDAFSGCASLTEISIPDSVEKVGRDAFSGCPNLLYTQHGNALYLGNKDNPFVALIAPAEEYIFKLDIHENTKAIGGYAMKGRADLRIVSIPDGVKSIGWGAFLECKNLQKIVVPESVKEIDGVAFSDCDSLSEVVLPNGIKSIPNSAFANCSSLACISVPSGAEYINEHAFFRCHNLRSIKIPKSLKCVVGNAFGGCERLKEVFYEGSESEWQKIYIHRYGKDLFRLLDRPGANEKDLLHLFDGSLIGGKTEKLNEYLLSATMHFGE